MSVAATDSSLPRYPLQLVPGPFEGPGTFELRERQLNLLTPQEYRAYGGGFRHSTNARAQDAGTAAQVRSILTNRQNHPECWIPNSGRVCPQCISENSMRGSVGWEIRLADACAIHGLWLVDRCKCGKPLDGRRRTIDRCDECATKLACLETRQAPGALISVCRVLVQKVAGPSTSTYADLRDPLKALDFAKLHLLLRLLGVFADPNGTPTHLRSLRQFDPLERSWRASLLGAEILDRWPLAFIEALEWNRRSHDCGDTYSLQRTLGRLYRVIFAQLNDPAFDFVRDELKKYLAANWRGQFAQSSRLRDVSFLACSWVSADEAKEMLDVSPAAVRDYVDRGLLVSDVRMTPRGRQKVLVTRESVLTLAQSTQPRSQTLKDAARTLGLKRSRLARIAPSVFPHAWRTAGGEWRIPESDLQPLLIAAKSLKTRTVAKDEITLIDAIRYHRMSDSTLVGWLLDGAAGSVRPVAYARYSTGVAGWIFKRSYVRIHLSRANTIMRSNFCTLSEAANRLKLKDEVVYQLANRGELETAPSWTVTSRGRLISTQAIERFQRQFIPARHIALAVRTSPRHVAHLLGRMSVEPALGPASGYRQVFYRRDETLSVAVRQRWGISLPLWSAEKHSLTSRYQPRQNFLDLSIP